MVDIGAGTGPASLVLAAEGAEVTAIDTHPPFLARLRELADAAGLGRRIQTLQAPMEDLPLPDASADLVWAEGSAYVMGFDAALAVWRRLLGPRRSAGTHRGRVDNARAALAAGWTVAATYLLPDTDWAADYDPLAARIAQLRQQRPGDGAALDEVEREIEVRRAHGRDYGYTGYVLRPR